jgi:hypothetical protein
MKAFRHLFSIKRHLTTAEPAWQFQGMASGTGKNMDISSRYEMNSGFEIPVLGYGVSSQL